MCKDYTNFFREYIIFCGYNNVDRFEIVDDVESVRESSGGRYNATIDEFAYPEMLGADCPKTCLELK